MKLIHLSDLHLGKYLGAYPLIEDQRFILDQIEDVIRSERPDAILIAGDIYDRAVPSTQAIQLFDDFITSMHREGIPLLIGSGNHDSTERLAFGGRLLSQDGIYISPRYDGSTTKMSLRDESGVVDIYILPYLKPAHVRLAFPEREAEITSYEEALAVAIESMELNPEHRSVLVAHQFVTGASRTDSETITVGSTDNIGASVFDPFDYVALGHLHRPQFVGDGERIRYCGSPLKYSLSEETDEKSVTVVELTEKEQTVRLIPLKPLHEVRRIRGSYETLVGREFYEGMPQDDYIHAVLTDEEDVINAFQRLQTIYPNLTGLEYDNKRTKAAAHEIQIAEIENRSPQQLFEDLYHEMNAEGMREEQRSLVAALIEEIWGGEA